MSIIEALQLFFTKGLSAGSVSLTTPIELPPQIARARITQPNACLAKALKASVSGGVDNYNDPAAGYDLTMDIDESIQPIAYYIPLFFLLTSILLPLLFISISSITLYFKGMFFIYFL